MLVTITFALVVTATVVYTFTVRPVYQASTEILVRDSKNNTGSILDGLSDLVQPLGSSDRRVTDEMAILRTAVLRNRVAQDLIDNPIIHVKGKSDTLEILVPSQADRQKGIGPFALPKEIEARLLNSVSFTNQTNSDIIEVTVKSHSPYEAALIANVYAKDYYDLNLNSSRTMARNIRKFLQTQLGDAQVSLNRAEDSLRGYMQSQRIVSLSDEAKSLIEAISTMEAQRDDVIVEEKSQQNVLDMYQGQLAKMESSFSSHVSDALDPYISLLQQQIAELQVNRDVAIARNSLVGNRQVFDKTISEADSQIASLKSKLRTKTAEFLKSQIVASGTPQQVQNGSGDYDPTGYYKELKLKVLQQEIGLSSIEARRQALDKIVSEYEEKFSKIPKQSIRLAELERNEKSSEKLFLMIQDNYRQAQIAEQSQFGNAQIVDPALAPAKPISPKIPYNLALGVMLGLALSIGLAFVLDHMDRSVRSPEDLEKKGYKVFAAIPMIPHTNARKGKRAREKMVPVDGTSVPMRLIALHSPSHPVTESYLSLRTAIQYSKIVKNIETLLVVSSLPREGKSTTVANLAVAFAKAGMKTLILDADLRMPIMHRLWKVDRKPGLIEYLKGENGLNDVLRKTFVENLFLLSAGTIPPNPSELLSSYGMKGLLDTLKTMFDIIVVDSPPVLAVTDASILSQLTDAVLYVTSANSTKMDYIELGFETLKQVDAGILGFVLNEFEYGKTYGRYNGYRYYAHYYRPKGAVDEKI